MPVFHVKGHLYASLCGALEGAHDGIRCKDIYVCEYDILTCMPARWRCGRRARMNQVNEEFRKPKFHLYASSLAPWKVRTNWPSSQPASPASSHASAGARGRMNTPNHWRASAAAVARRASIACSNREDSERSCSC